MVLEAKSQASYTGGSWGSRMTRRDISLGLGFDAPQHGRKSRKEASGLLSERHDGHGRRLSDRHDNRGRRMRRKGRKVLEGPRVGGLAEEAMPDIGLEFSGEEIEEGEIFTNSECGEDESAEANARLLCNLRDVGNIDIDIASQSDRSSRASSGFSGIFAARPLDKDKSPSRRLPAAPSALPPPPTALPSASGAKDNGPQLARALDAAAALNPLHLEMSLREEDQSAEPVSLGQHRSLPPPPSNIGGQGTAGLIGRRLPDSPDRLPVGSTEADSDGADSEFSDFFARRPS